MTADGFFRGSKTINLKKIADKAVTLSSTDGVKVTSVILLEHLKRVTVPQGAVLPKVRIFGDKHFLPEI